jgi:hypothetical protein
MKDLTENNAADVDDRFDKALDEMALGESGAKFLARVEEYRWDALCREDAHMACLGKLSADQMEMIHHVGREIMNAIAADPQLMKSPRVEAALRMHLSLGHQLKHLQNLEARFTELSQPKNRPRSRRSMPRRKPSSRRK